MPNIHGRLTKSLWLFIFLNVVGLAQGQYFLIVDAGSSGSRLRMFNTTTTGLVEIVPSDSDEASFETRPGLSAYAQNPDAAGPSLSGLIAAAQGYIPAADQAEAQLFVKATAGMRLLLPSEANAVFTAVRVFLGNPSNCPFKFVSAETISGEEEAVFAYIAVNTLLNSLSADGVTAGVLEMGGASIQLAFKPMVDIRENEFQFYLNKSKTSIYVKSWVSFGTNQMVLRGLEALAASSPSATSIAHPCYFIGYSEEATISGRTINFTGTSNASECSTLVASLMLIDEAECLMPPCAMQAGHVATLSGQYYGLASYFYIANGLGLVGWSEARVVTPVQVAAGATDLCSKNVTGAQASSSTDFQYLKHYCLLATFMYQALSGYGFADDSTSITFARKLNGRTVEWPFGAALYEASLMPLHAPAQDCVAAPADSQYTLIVDAGSSGTRLKMFNTTRTGLVEIVPSDADEDDFETRPGLSAYTQNLAGAGPSMSGMMAAAQRYIPAADQASTRLFVKATAGMRLLPASEANAVFTAVRIFLSNPSNCPFKFVTAETISGEQEAVLAYITVNTLLSTMSVDGATTGVLEMGGASKQLAFKPDRDIRENEFQFYYKQVRTSVYAKSWMRFGQDQVILRSQEALAQASPSATVIEHPCYFVGYSEEAIISGRTINFTGTSNALGCADHVQALMLIDEADCLMPRCAMQARHVVGLSGQYYGLAAYFYIVNGLGLVGWNQASIVTPRQIGTSTVDLCHKDVDGAKAASSTDFIYLKYYCLLGTFIHQALTGYGFGEDSVAITFARKVNGKTAGWPLGAAMWETQMMPVSLSSQAPLCVRAAVGAAFKASDTAAYSSILLLVALLAIIR